MLLLAVVLSSCGTGSGSDGGSGSGAPLPSSSPEPVRYSDDDLTAALPKGRKQRHGYKVSDQGRDLADGCREDGKDSGQAYVFATRAGATRSVMVDVRSRWDRSSWRDRMKDQCPRGPIDQAVEHNEDGSFTPGERGTAKRKSYSVGTWRGFACTKDIKHVFPTDFDPQDLTVPSVVLLSNGFHSLMVSTTGGIRFTKKIATEYLERLES